MSSSEVGDAIQVQSPTEVHVRQTPQDGEEVGQTHEEYQEPTSSKAQEIIAEAKREENRKWVPTADGIEVDSVEVDNTVYDTPDPVWPGMSKSDFRRFGMYLRSTADRLGLRDWAFNLKWEPCPDDDNTLASISCIEGQKRASINLCKEFAHHPSDEQKRGLIHELLHCHFDALDRVTFSVCSLIGQPTFTVFNQAHHSAVEFAVDALACELACLLPDIPEG